MNSVIEIKLLGQDYSLKTELDTLHAKSVVEYVAKKVDEADRESEGHSKLDIIILAALDIANDFLEAQEKHSDLIDDIASRSEFLLRKIETRSVNTPGKRSAFRRVGSSACGDADSCHGREDDDSGLDGG